MFNDQAYNVLNILKLNGQGGLPPRTTIFFWH